MQISKLNLNMQGYRINGFNIETETPGMPVCLVKGIFPEEKFAKSLGLPKEGHMRLND